MLGTAPNAASANSYSFKSTTGWASINADGVNGTTGGSGGTEVTVTNAADLERYATANTLLKSQVPSISLQKGDTLTSAPIKQS